MEQKELYNLLEDLIKQPKESEWVECKENYHSAEEIGERISALANGAGLYNHQFGYLVFGVTLWGFKRIGGMFILKF